MATGVPMSARRFTAVLALVAAACFHARGAPAPGVRPPEARNRTLIPDLRFHQAQTQPERTSPSTDDSNPSADQKTVHEKTGPYSSRSVRHTRVAEESAPPPELTQAEDAIQRRNYAGAEPLLRKVVEQDPANYVAWFDLGFVENGLGKLDDSITAYRKSVAAKPDVFESNLNLGLQLAKSGHSEAENFLRAATQLKPSSNISEGKFRAWLSLANVLEKSNREEALTAYHQAAILQPKDPEPHLAAGHLLEQDNKFADAEQEYKQALALDPASDALTGLANIYMRGRRFAEAEEYGDLAFAASENKDYSLTVKALDARAKLLPEVPFTYFLRASALDHLHDYKQAAANYHLFLNTGRGKYPDQEWQAKHRLTAIE